MAWSTTSLDFNGLDKRIDTNTVTDFQLNVDFTPEELDIHFPKGTLMEDLVAGRKYTVGEATPDERLDAAAVIPTAGARTDSQIAAHVKPEAARSSEPLAGRTEAMLEEQTGTLRYAWLALALGIVFALALVCVAALVVRRRLLRKQLSGEHRAYRGQATSHKGAPIGHLE